MTVDETARWGSCGTGWQDHFRENNTKQPRIVDAPGHAQGRSLRDFETDEDLGEKSDAQIYDKRKAQLDLLNRAVWQCIHLNSIAIKVQNYLLAVNHPRGAEKARMRRKHDGLWIKRWIRIQLLSEVDAWARRTDALWLFDD
ncbi:MAG: hypothetical protein ACRD72_01710 [Candidatus Angelobacter sp.]